MLTNAQSWNRYSYVENDPINHLDPSGHRKVKYENGQDPDDDDRARKRAQACRNPGRYTGSCPGGPPDPAYAADGDAGDAAKRAGRAASAGNLAAAAAWAQSASHFASIAGTAAAQTAAIQAWASVWAAVQAMQASRPLDNRSPSASSSPPPPWAGISGGGDVYLKAEVPFPTTPFCADSGCQVVGPSVREIAVANCLSRGGDNCDTITDEMAVNSRVMWTSRCRVVCTTQSRPGVDHEANPEPAMTR